MTVEVTERALAFTDKDEMMVVGGVAANKRLAEMLSLMVGRHAAAFHVVPLKFSGDCGAQIAWTGNLAFRSGGSVPVAESMIKQSWRLDTVPIPWRSQT
jgi:N6-L-threonylcarbamoyladenine synthase